MNERKLGNDGDTYLDSSGQVARCSTYMESVVQRVRCYMRTFQGECFVNSEHGMPWYDDVLGEDSFMLKHVAATVKENVLLIDGVNDVDEINLSLNGRSVTGSIRIVTDEGTATVTV